MVDGERDQALCPGLRRHPPPVDSAEQTQTQALDPNQEAAAATCADGPFHPLARVKLYLTSQVNYEQIPIRDDSLATAWTKSGMGN